MNRTVLNSTVGSDGVLQLILPVGEAAANQPVRITIEPTGSSTPAPAQWRQQILNTAGKWQGEFVRPEQGEFELREPLA